MVLVNKNKRHGPDSMLRYKKYLVIAAWTLTLLVFIIISSAKPRFVTMFDRLYDTMTMDGLWNKEVLKYAFYLLIPLALFSVTGLIINSRRHRRKRDKYSKTLIISLFLSLTGIVLYLIFFF